jgi:bifunctional UDP-N-acetylglucosamine pyrophosphorylase/glucosamine-1-phosphate N-acetyltransferase
MPDESFSILILAAGKATCFKSKHSKMLHRLAGRPLGEYILRTALAAGPDCLYMMIGDKGEEIRQAFQRPGLVFIEQHEQLGTGHAVRTARPETLRALVESHCKARTAATILTTRPENPTRYGRIVRTGSRVRAIVEEKVATPAQ